jgi:hypothetical protein
MKAGPRPSRLQFRKVVALMAPPQRSSNSFGVRCFIAQFTPMIVVLSTPSANECTRILGFYPGDGVRGLDFNVL